MGQTTVRGTVGDKYELREAVEDESWVMGTVDEVERERPPLGEQ